MTKNARWHKKYQHGNQNMGFMGQIRPNMGQNMGFMGFMGFMDFMGRVDTLETASCFASYDYFRIGNMQ